MMSFLDNNAFARPQVSFPPYLLELFLLGTVGQCERRVHGRAMLLTLHKVQSRIRGVSCTH